MKYFKILAILLGAVLSIYACSDNSSTVKENARESLDVPTTPNPTTTADPTATPKVPEPAQNAEGVWHYTCSKGCAGGSGAATDKCGNCGGPLAHNTAYHANANNTPKLTPPTTPGSAPISAPNDLSVTKPTTVPSQNTTGVWHYTCSKGCAGGGGNKTEKCGTCGGPLTHNQAYHN